MTRVIQKDNKWMIQKKSFFTWDDVKSFEVLHKANLYKDKLDKGE